ncbi:hypothetical protein C9374_014375 [Naegleria lovaniensis]|uniref:Uncharacterized protein n=1 Tax=Naegleria lovaniensis TaxID=51637 RepID=A0AA88KMI2_NAELO|nr:uncharacterized protein C9374_014375 [Naegleria lovaniensis]KAG2388975.1 hypothetical protein C9374_014375 [Naegleria lovaniensis]
MQAYTHTLSDEEIQNKTMYVKMKQYKDAIKQDIFSTLINKPMRNEIIIEKLKKENDRIHDPEAKEDIKYGIRVLLLLSDFSEETESLEYATQAHNKSSIISSSKYKQASACRILVHKAFENNSNAELAQEALEMRSNSKNFQSSLKDCANAFFLMYLTTANYYEESSNYCMKASLFDQQFESRWCLIQERKLETCSLEEMKL